MELILIIVVLVLLFGGGGGYWGRSRGYWSPKALLVLRKEQQGRRSRVYRSDSTTQSPGPQ
jgi:hypothetical protein